MMQFLRRSVLSNLNKVIRFLFLFVMIVSTILEFAKAGECSNKDGSFSIICPETDDLSHYTKCCWNQTSVHCCPHHISLAVNSDNTVMFIGLGVISTCLTIAITIVICCFWSRCLLFNMCRVNYTYGDIVAYTKEEEALNSLPYEGGGNCKTFSPCQVKIKPVQDI